MSVSFDWATLAKFIIKKAFTEENKKSFSEAIDNLMNGDFDLLRDKFKNLHKSATAWWFRKEIAIIGPVASGKTSFWKRLKGEQAPSAHVNTISPEKISKFRFKKQLSNGESLDIFVSGVEVGGEENQRQSYWRDTCTNADIIFFIIEANVICQDGYQVGAVQQDLLWLQSHFPNFDKQPHVHFLLNKIDKLSEEDFSNLDSCVSKFEKHVTKTFAPFQSRFIGCSPISMTSDQFFTKGLDSALACIHSTMTKEK